MRPMKGTVRRGASAGTAASLDDARALLAGSTKERAENLMIVDLVRHDLHGVCGPGAVTVPQLMRVEAYASVFQMVSVVQATLPHQATALDVLAASLPPGSMTGAPKRRSCELLAALEPVPERGVYSGLVGYVDAAGRSDWSVTIRTLFRWDDDEEEGEGEGDAEVWRIGAGGAVTALSSPEAEWDEMLAKLAGPLSAFYSSDPGQDETTREGVKGGGYL